MKKEINFIWESEKKIRVSEAGQKNSLFYEAYQQALAGVTEIVRASRVYCGDIDPFCQGEVKLGDDDSSFGEDQNYYNYPNNMIVFSGERGAGKSSAMLTFVNSLKDHKSKLYCEKFLRDVTKGELPGIGLKDVSNMLEKCQFVSIPPIDPTTLENGGQILIVILARMYKLASDAWEEQGRSCTASRKFSPQDRINRKNELMRKFSTCYEHVNAIKNWDKKNFEYEGLDVLSELGDSSRLKNEFAELVEALLEFCCDSGYDNQYLIIQIDDTDMNIQGAYEILEDIRKYLVIPHVIIVMAADLTHLVQVVESSVLASYEQRSENATEHASNIARQYITKLFPQTRQINLPNLGTYFKEHADNIRITYNTFSKNLVLPDNQEKFQDVQEQIFRLIYRKTGLVFLRYKNLLHYIVPGNMRHLAHFLAMLVQMEQIVDPDKEEIGFFLPEDATEAKICEHKRNLRIRLQNVQRFRDYFLTTWVTANLDDIRAKKINELVEIDISKKVRYACMHLPYFSDKTRDNKRKGTNSYNGTCSYADMVRLCKECEKKSTDEMDSRFIFAIQTYFSLLGHTVVLEELIDYYETKTNTPADDFKKCAFTRLIPLFGSRLFSNSFERSAEDKESFACVETFEEGAVRRRIHTRWQVKKEDVKVGPDPVTVYVLGLLCSMFADYEGDKAGITLDLCSPITNCLYMGDYNKATPLAQLILNGKTSTAGKVEDKEWKALRNSALLTVLNSDVQQRIGNRLSQITVSSQDADINQCEVWAATLKEFYNVLTSLFNDQPGESEMVITALKRMQFSGWFEPIFLGTSGSGKNIAITSDWYNTASTLIVDLNGGQKTESGEMQAKTESDTKEVKDTKQKEIDIKTEQAEPVTRNNSKTQENAIAASGEDEDKRENPVVEELKRID